MVRLLIRPRRSSLVMCCCFTGNVINYHEISCFKERRDVARRPFTGLVRYSLMLELDNFSHLNSYEIPLKTEESNIQK